MLNYHLLKNDFLIFRGKDKLDLINRLSTNKVDKLSNNQGLKTILTNDKGKIIDLLTLFIFEDFIFTTCSLGYGEKVKTHLNKYTIMDDFKCENIKGTHEAILCFSSVTQTSQIKIEKFSNEVFSFNLANITNNDFKIINEKNFDVIISRNDDRFYGFVIIYPIEAKSIIENKYFTPAIKEKYSLQKIDDVMFNNLRIEYGIPTIGNEMNEDTNPLECDLTKYVSFTKGCYIGQEVIARQDSYDKISKHLVGVIFEKEFNTNLQDENIKIISDKKECGYVTSRTVSQKFGNIGLGFVKTSFLDYSKEYLTKVNYAFYKCSLKELPF